MRRDEIKIFPGNVEAHINRLISFPDESPPVAREQAATTETPAPVLEYMDPPVARELRNTKVRSVATLIVSNIARGLFGFALLCVLFLFAQGRWDILAVIVGALCAPLCIWGVLVLAQKLSSQR